MKYEDRTYRSLINNDNLFSYNVIIEESDLWISSESDLSSVAYQSLLFHRHTIEKYIKYNPDFRTSLLPFADDEFAPLIIQEMISKSKICGVGPMASVAGAVAEFVGKDLLPHTSNIIIENGGDIFLRSTRDVTVGLFAGESTLSYKLNLLVKKEKTPLGICTSSATVGPSLSFGRADAVTVISKSAVLADAAASAIGNLVFSKNDIKKTLELGIKIDGVYGIVIIIGSEMGAIGEIEFV